MLVWFSTTLTICHLNIYFNWMKMLHWLKQTSIFLLRAKFLADLDLITMNRELIWDLLDLYFFHTWWRFRWKPGAIELGCKTSDSTRCSKGIGISTLWGIFCIFMVKFEHIIFGVLVLCFILVWYLIKTTLQAAPPVVHRDIKSSNILLNQFMRARVRILFLWKWC